MQDYILHILAAAKVAAPIVGYWLLATCLLNLIAHKSQVNAWCEKNPKRAAVLKVLRGLGCDPWLLIQGLSLAVIGRLPAKLRELIPVFLAALVLSGCVGTLEESRGAIRVTNIAGLTRDDKRCAVLSDRNTGFKVSAVTLGAIAPVLLVGSGQVKSDRWQTGLQIASGTSGALAGGAAIGQAYTAASYIEEGCAK